MNLVRDFHYAEQSRLLSFRHSLVEKLDVLNGLDKEILGDMTKEGDFELKKWTTICASLLKKMNEFESLYFGNSPEVEGENKVLGVTWNNFEDNLLFSLKDVIESELNSDIVTNIYTACLVNKFLLFFVIFLEYFNRRNFSEINFREVSTWIFAISRVKLSRMVILEKFHEINFREWLIFEKKLRDKKIVETKKKSV